MQWSDGHTILGLIIILGLVTAFIAIRNWYKEWKEIGFNRVHPPDFDLDFIESDSRPDLSQNRYNTMRINSQIYHIIVGGHTFKVGEQVLFGMDDITETLTISEINESWVFFQTLNTSTTTPRPKLTHGVFNKVVTQRIIRPLNHTPIQPYKVFKTHKFV